MKLCKDCKHIGKSKLTGELVKCYRPDGIDLVTGVEARLDNYCSTERTPGWINSYTFGYCGKQARYFEAKENS